MSEPVTPRPGEWPAGARVLTTTRQAPDAAARGLGGWNLADHVGDEPTAVAQNRRALLAGTGLTEVQWLSQVHGTRWVEADRDSAARVPEADAAWTRERGLGLAVLTADCVPVALADRQATVVAVAHGGWRGLVAGVLENLVAALPVPAGDLVAWLGPAIGPSVYEVGPEVRAAVAALPDGDRLAAEVFRLAPRSPGGGKGHLDLFGLSQRLLERAGVGAVHSDRLCTYSDERFFSYRRDGRTGRMVTLAWLE